MVIIGFLRLKNMIVDMFIFYELWIIWSYKIIFLEYLNGNIIYMLSINIFLNNFIY